MWKTWKHAQLGGAQLPDEARAILAGPGIAWQGVSILAWPDQPMSILAKSGLARPGPIWPGLTKPENAGHLQTGQGWPGLAWPSPRIDQATPGHT